MFTALNCPDGIKMWNNYKQGYASGILKRLSEKQTSKDSIVFTNEQIEKLKEDAFFIGEEYNR